MVATETPSHVDSACDIKLFSDNLEKVTVW